MGKNKQKCAFCGREMENLFRAEQPGVYICHECIEAGHNMIREMKQYQEDETDVKGLSLGSLPKPAEIKAFLDQYVIGQDDADTIFTFLKEKNHLTNFYKLTFSSLGFF